MEKDYLMRLIEEAVAFLVSAISKANAGMLAEASQDLDTICMRTIGLDLTALKNTSPDEVLHLLEQGGALRVSRSVILAEILLADADLLERAPSTGLPLKNLVHAFCLLSDSVDALGIDDEKIYRAKLHALAARLQPYSGIPALKERFMRLADDA